MNGVRTERFRELVVAHSPVAGSAAHAEILTFLDSVDDPFDSEFFDPGHVTAGGVVLSPERERLLLVDHRRLRKWVEPGGHVDPEDFDPVAAAAREVIEETGVTGLVLLEQAIFGLHAHNVPGRPPQPPHRHFNVNFLFAAGAATLRPSPEVAGARWVAFEDVPALTDDTAVHRSAERAAAWARGGS